MITENFEISSNVQKNYKKAARFYEKRRHLN